MRATICDACGKIYKPYSEINGYGEGNMLTIVKTERDGHMHGKMRLELCPECMVKAYDLIAEHLVVDGSPADMKYYQDVEEKEEHPVVNAWDAGKNKSETAEE